MADDLQTLREVTVAVSGIHRELSLMTKIGGRAIVLGIGAAVWLGLQINSLQIDGATIKGEFGVMKAELATVKGDLIEVKADIKQAKADVADVKAEVKQLRGDFDQFKATLGRIETRLGAASPVAPASIPVAGRPNIFSLAGLGVPVVVDGRRATEWVVERWKEGSKFSVAAVDQKDVAALSAYASKAGKNFPTATSSRWVVGAEVGRPEEARLLGEFLKPGTLVYWIAESAAAQQSMEGFTN
jgi:hypothetical protein